MDRKIYDIHLRGFSQEEWEDLQFARAVLGLSSMSATIFALLRDLLPVYRKHMLNALENIAVEQKGIVENHERF